MTRRRRTTRRLVRHGRAGTLTGGRLPDGVVLLLQEARRVGAEVPADLASALDLHLFYAPGMRNGRGRGAAARDDRGSAIVSSLPLSRLQALELPLERQRRVALGATLTGATRSGRAWSVRLVDVHLENRPGPGRLWVRAAAARTRQMAALRRVLPGDGALVIGGDLNTWRGGGEGALLDDRYGSNHAPVLAEIDWAAPEQEERP